MLCNSDYVNKHCTIDDVENRSDHLPLCMDISLPVGVNIVQESRQFQPKPKWHATTPAMITAYKQELDELLSTIYVLDDVINCTSLCCEDHNTFIESLHSTIISSILTAATNNIPYTQPYSKLCPSRSG